MEEEECFQAAPWWKEMHWWGGESGVGASGRGTERRNWKRQENVGGIQGWV